MSRFVDFKAVKAAVSMLQVLEHYGLAKSFKRTGNSLSGPCPLHVKNLEVLILYEIGNAWLDSVFPSSRLRRLRSAESSVPSPYWSVRC